MPNNNSQFVLSIDLGGTNIKSAIVLPDGGVRYFRSYPTQSDKCPEKIIDELVAIINDTAVRANLTIDDLYGIAIAFAGILDVKKGVVTSAPSLPGWYNIPLRHILNEKLGKINMHLINDASAAALGEHRFGAGCGVGNLIYLTVSTGIGGGIIIGGKLYMGTDGCAGEIGHMIVEANGPQCNCGNLGCLEVLASGTAIAKEAKKRIEHGEPSSIIKFAGRGFNSITAEAVALAAKQGDQLACDIVNKAGYYLGIALTNMVNIFNPEVIVIGGGVSRMGNMLLIPARKVVKNKAFELPSKTARIIRSRLGDKAGIVGAAISLLDSQERK